MCYLLNITVAVLAHNGVFICIVRLAFATPSAPSCCAIHIPYTLHIPYTCFYTNVYYILYIAEFVAVKLNYKTSLLLHIFSLI